MRKIGKINLIIILALFFGAYLVTPIFAGTSISGTVSCRVPHIIALSDEDQALAEEKVKANTNIAEAAEENFNSIMVESKLLATIQQEEVISEDTNEVEIIITICAK